MGPATPSRLALNEASWSGTARSARYKWTSEPAARDRPGFPPLARTTSTQIPLARLPHTSGPASLQLATGPAFPRLPEPPPHKYRLPDCLIRVELRARPETHFSPVRQLLGSSGSGCFDPLSGSETLQFSFWTGHPERLSGVSGQTLRRSALRLLKSRMPGKQTTARRWNSIHLEPWIS